MCIFPRERWARKPVNHTSWVAVVTPTDRPKSVRNRCLIELFEALFVLSLCPFDISVGVGAFVIGLGQISSFLSSTKNHGSKLDPKIKVISTVLQSKFTRVTACYFISSFLSFGLITLRYSNIHSNVI